MQLLTAKDAERRILAAARGLAEYGLSPGDRVAVVTPEHAEPGVVPEAQAATLATVIACLRLGLVPVMVNPLLTATERGTIVADCRPSLVLDGAGPMLALPTDRGRIPDLSDVPLGRPMHYTSGTTGRPKGVWAPDLTAGESGQLWLDESSLWGFDGDTYLLHSPLCHSAPLRFAIAVLLTGGSVALAGRFYARRIASAVIQFRPTTAFVVPAHLQALLTLPGGPPASTYRLLLHAGSACPPTVKRATHAWAGVDRVFEFYGSTEGQFTACSGPEWEQRPGTVGRARPGRALSTDADGTIWCTPPPFARFSYWEDPVRTRAAWRDGAGGRAFTVGDHGRLDADGYLFIDGRREDLIISGGVNVYPAEVEAVLAACPGVRDVVVYAVPHEKWGQMVCAAVVGDADLTTMQAWVSERLASYKRPKSWRFLPELPRNAMGKIERSALPGPT